MKALCPALTAAIVAVGICAPCALEARAQRDARIGRWQVNIALSKWDPGPAPKRQTLVIEAAGQGERIRSEVTGADGTTTVTTYTAAFDGTDYPLTGSRTADTVSLKRIDARTTERTDKKGGKVVQVITRVVSADGKTMTATVKGTSPQGRPIHNVVVFERR
jgi:hypothetical protein